MPEDIEVRLARFETKLDTLTELIKSNMECYSKYEERLREVEKDQAIQKTSHDTADKQNKNLIAGVGFVLLLIEFFLKWIIK